MEYDEYFMGFDLGTTYSCIAIYKDGQCVIIPNDVWERTNPSVVNFDGPNRVFVGKKTLYHMPKNNRVKIRKTKLPRRKYSKIYKNNLY